MEQSALELTEVYPGASTAEPGQPDKYTNVPTARGLAVVKNSDNGQVQHRTSRSYTFEQRQANAALDETEEKPPYMLRPDGVLRMIWDLITLSMLLYLAIAIPFWLGFDEEPKNGLQFWEYTIDVFFGIDLLVNFRTGILHPDGRHDYDAENVARNYLQGWFLLDLISAVPYELILSSLDSLKAAKLIKLNRVMKVFKVLRLSKFSKVSNSPFLEDAEDWMTSHHTQNLIKMLNLLLLTGFSSHIIACFWSLIGISTSPSWMDSYSVTLGLDDEADVDSWGLSRRYVAAQYWAITTMTTVGYGDIIPANNAERLYSIMAMVIGGSFYGYIIATMASVVTSMDVLKREFNDKIESISSYMESKQFPQQLRRKVRRYFKRYYNERTALNEALLIKLMEPRLRDEVIQFLLTKSIKGHVVFDLVPSDTIAKVLPLLKPLLVKAGGWIISSDNAHTKDMYILTGGSAWEIEHKQGSTEVTRLLTKGESFGEEWCFQGIFARDVSIQALEDTTLFLLNGDDLQHAFANNHEQLEQLRHSVLKYTADSIKERPTEAEIRHAEGVLRRNELKPEASKGKPDVLNPHAAAQTDGAESQGTTPASERSFGEVLSPASSASELRRPRTHSSPRQVGSSRLAPPRPGDWRGLQGTDVVGRIEAALSDLSARVAAMEDRQQRILSVVSGSGDGSKWPSARQEKL